MDAPEWFDGQKLYDLKVETTFIPFSGTAPTIDADPQVRTAGWEFTNTEEFRVKPESKGSDIWLVGRRGKPSFKVSKKDLGTTGLGRPYHCQGIPYKLIARAIANEEDKAAKVIEKAAHDEQMRQFIEAVQKSRERKATPEPELSWISKLWSAVQAFFRRFSS